jgi:plasmid stability protein
MASLQVRDFPAGLYEQLKARAKQEHRSVSQQTIIAIREHVAEAAARTRPISLSPVRKPWMDEDAQSRIERRKKLFAEIHAIPKVELPPDFPSIVEIVHEGRDER